MRRLRTALAALVLGSAAHAEPTTVEVCFNYGCAGKSVVWFEPERLEAVGAMLAAAEDAAASATRSAAAVGVLYRMAGEQAQIRADRAGNYLDDGAYGRMDCIDHSITTTRFLELLASRGWLRHHWVMAPVRRTRFLLFQHFSAAIEAHAAAAALSSAACDCDNAHDNVAAAPGAPATAEAETRFVIDSWFVESGEAAVVLPLSGWLKGEGPNVQ